METKNIVIVGAGGQAKNISLLIEQIGGWKIQGFVDDDSEKKGMIIRGYPVLGTFDEVFSLLNHVAVALAIGDSAILEEKVRTLKSMDRNFNFPNLIHPNVEIDDNSVSLGEGNTINSRVVFTTDIEIGSFNYFNRCCSVSHDTIMGDYCFVHAGVHLSGDLVVGDKVWFGVNSTIIDDLKIGDKVIIGAGAVVLKSVEDNAVMVGNPARLLKYRE
jgi:sugar O-acyltransferase (sialic acid O-acetyltransferase NeuD family)